MNMTPQRQIRRTLGALQRGDASGYSLIEMLAFLAVIVTLAAFIMPFTRTTLNAFNLTSDARNLSSATGLAKMRAAAFFTKARIYVDLGTKMYRVERWKKVAPVGWVIEGGTSNLSGTVSFGFAGLTTPPPNTQAAIGQATPCLNDANVVIAGIVFKSRGVPGDASNAPTGAGAFYLGDGATVYSITAGAGGRVQLWQSNVITTTWTLR
jgi:type II secretory pathway pseudopilin PulG